MDGKDRKISLIPDKETGMWFWCILEYVKGSGCGGCWCSIRNGTKSSMNSAYAEAKAEWETLPA